jgi:ribosome-associated translation inhibitor RaiA
MSPIFRGDFLMMVTTTFRHKTQDCKLKSYVNKIIENLSFYTDLINCIQITFETDSCRKGNAKYGCHISLHLLGKKNIDIKVISRYARDAFDLAFNQLSSRLKNSVRHKKIADYS